MPAAAAIAAVSVSSHPTLEVTTNPSSSSHRDPGAIVPGRRGALMLGHEVERRGF